MSIFLELFITFFKIGLFTFGGGYAMLPLIQKEVLAHDWMEIEEIINFIAVSESTPGPFAINCATYVGMETGGVVGAICATLGVVLPSFIVILIVARFYKQFKESKIVSSVMTGLRPAVIGLIGSALVSMILTVFLPNGFDLGSIVIPDLLVSLAIAVVMTVLVFKKVHPIIIIVLSAIVGIVSGFLLN
ncbi:MAG: chromate transporter [Ruminococcaceae bacterium]|nr:chromate transporter [Oscillospiraceae bacterium]